MPTTWWEGQKPQTKFAPKFKVPLYYAKDGGKEMIANLSKYCVELEQGIISREELVSEVPKNSADPYKFTQQWKQHHLFDDKLPRKGGETFEKFPDIPEQRQLFNLIREHYLIHLRNLGYERRKVYIHAWANVLREGEFISQHMHLADEFCYLSGTYYLTTSGAKLNLINPMRVQEMSQFPNEAGLVMFFPSWLPHYSEVYTGKETRISIAWDIVAEENMRANPWRPHELFDDPEKMPGLD